MQIRQLTSSDAPAYNELRLRMLREHASAFTSSFEEDAEKPLAWIEKRLAVGRDAPHDFVLGAFGEAGDLVGIVGLAVASRAKERHKGVLFGMYVAAEAAQGGVGRALLSHCLDRARTIPGLEQINLTVTATSERARRFYEAAGFRAFGLEECAVKLGNKYYPKAHMVLYLDPGARRMSSPSPNAVAGLTRQITLTDALSRLSETATPRSVELFRHGTLQVKWYAPRGKDLQQPHTRDEAYVVVRGAGEFVHGEQRERFGPGDFLFASAGVAHRFENFSDDLGVWVLFYGPQGGEGPEPA